MYVWGVALIVVDEFGVVNCSVATGRSVWNKQGKGEILKLQQHARGVIIIARQLFVLGDSSIIKLKRYRFCRAKYSAIARRGGLIMKVIICIVDDVNSGASEWFTVVCTWLPTCAMLRELPESDIWKYTLFCSGVSFMNSETTFAYLCQLLFLIINSGAISITLFYNAQKNGE